MCRAFNVNQHVLIPRPETEELVEWILTDHSNQRELKVLDVGSGSGCVALTLAFERNNWIIQGIDISTEAILVAIRNAHTLGMHVGFKRFDFLKDVVLLDQYDLIVSNPPYIPRRELEFMDESVINYEPHEALFTSNDNPLIFYKRFAKLILEQDYKGMVYLEMNEFHAAEIGSFFHKNKVTIKNDLQGKMRMIRIEPD